MLPRRVAILSSSDWFPCAPRARRAPPHVKAPPTSGSALSVHQCTQTRASGSPAPPPLPIAAPPSCSSSKLTRRSGIGDSRGVVEGLERSVVGPGLFGGVEAMVGGTLGEGLSDEGVAVEVRVPGEGAERDDSRRSSRRVRAKESGLEGGLKESTRRQHRGRGSWARPWGGRRSGQVGATLALRPGGGGTGYLGLRGECPLGGSECSLQRLPEHDPTSDEPNTLPDTNQRPFETAGAWPSAGAVG